MLKKGPTIKDVAAHAGVSIMAVSRVYNPSSGGQVSPAMRAKVMEAIEVLGYRPDALARSLRRRRSDTVGFYSGYREMLLLNDEFRSNIFTGLQDASTQLGQDLLVFNVPKHHEPLTDLVRDLSTSKVDGVIFLPREGEEELAQLLVQSHQNVVAIVEALPGLPAITAQDAAGSRRLAEHLAGLGHRHIIYRRCRVDLISATRRYEAFLNAATELGIKVTEARSTGYFDELDDIERELIRSAPSIGATALVAWHDYSAIKAMLWCLELGMRIPDDIAIAGFDRISAPICPPGIELTTIEVDWMEIARRGVEFVVNGPDFAPKPDFFDQVIDRDGQFEIAIHSPLHVGNTT